jgi:hypothetical protein
MTDKPITMADLAVLLAKTTTEKKTRKKTVRTPEQDDAMKEKLRLMREKSAQNRKQKADERTEVLKTVMTPNLEIKRNFVPSESDSNELFEKKYNSKFEKLDETIGSIKSSLNEMIEMKKQKALEKTKVIRNVVPESSDSTKSETPKITPTPSNMIIGNSSITKVPKINYNNLFKR